MECPQCTVQIGAGGEISPLTISDRESLGEASTILGVVEERCELFPEMWKIAT